MNIEKKSPVTLTDTELIQRSQTGDEDAFTELVRRYTPLVGKLSSAAHLRSVREEVRAELWLAFVEATRSYDPTRGVPPAGYYAAQLRYRSWNRFKQYRRRWQHELFPDEDAAAVLEINGAVNDPAETSANRDLTERIVRLLPRLTPVQQKVAWYLYYRGFTRRETAVLLGCTPQAVSDAKRRLLARLRTLLEGK